MTYQEATKQASNKLDEVQEAFRKGEFENLDRLADELEQAKEQIIRNWHAR